MYTVAVLWQPGRRTLVAGLAGAACLRSAVRPILLGDPNFSQERRTPRTRPRMPAARLQRGILSGHGAQRHAAGPRDERFYRNASFIAECFRVLRRDIISCHGKDLEWVIGMNVHLREAAPDRGGVDYWACLRERSKLDAVPLMMEVLRTAEEYEGARKRTPHAGRALGLEFAWAENGGRFADSPQWHESGVEMWSLHRGETNGL